MKGCSASGDFDGDLDMVSFDPVLIDLVKATEAGRDVHGGAFPSRGQEAWPKGLIHIQMCFEYIEPMVSKGLSWQKNTRKVVGSGRRNAREKRLRLRPRALRLYLKKMRSPPQRLPKKQRKLASTTLLRSPPQPSAPQPSAAVPVHPLKG